MSTSTTHIKGNAPTYRIAFSDPEPVGRQELTNAQSPPPPPCSTCKGCPTKPCSSANVTLGTIARLPRESELPTWSVGLRQSGLNSGAFNHPGVPIAESPCGHLFLVAPVTSFNGRSIQAKYQTASQESTDNTFWTYLAISKPDLQPHRELSLLEIADGQQLAKDSYVHLDEFYWIEKSLMGDYRGAAAKLTAASLSYLQWACAIAQRHRQTHGIVSMVQRHPSQAESWRPRPRLPLQPLRQQPAAASKPQGIAKRYQPASAKRMDWTKLGHARAAAAV